MGYVWGCSSHTSEVFSHRNIILCPGKYITCSLSSSELCAHHRINHIYISKFKLPVRLQLIPLWLGWGKVAILLLPMWPLLTMGDMALLLLSGSESLDSPLGLLTPPWQGGGGVPCYCRLGWKSKLSTWSPMTLKGWGVLGGACHCPMG